MPSRLPLECLVGISDLDERTSDIEVDGSTMSWILRDITKQSALKQTAIGAASGGLAGYLCGRVGRLAAAGVGVSLLLIQVAQYKGYIRINWKNVEKEINEVKKSLGHTTQTSKMSDYIKESAEFVRSNVFLAAGFGSGFLIGLSV